MEGFRFGPTCLDAIFTLWRRAQPAQRVFKAVLPRRPDRLLSRSRLKERRRRRPYGLVRDYSKVKYCVSFPILLGRRAPVAGGVLQFQFWEYFCNVFIFPWENAAPEQGWLAATSFWKDPQEKKDWKLGSHVHLLNMLFLQ